MMAYWFECYEFIKMKRSDMVLLVFMQVLGGVFAPFGLVNELP